MSAHLTEKELARRLGMSIRTLQRWRWTGRGPAFLKLGGRVVYPLTDIESWEATCRIDPRQPTTASDR
jgi:predicted site-specific integrase-resolvase